MATPGPSGCIAGCSVMKPTVTGMAAAGSISFHPRYQSNYPSPFEGEGLGEGDAILPLLLISSLQGRRED